MQSKCKVKKEYLYASSQHLVEDVGSLLHESHVVGSGVGTLAVLDGVHEAVPELLERTQKVLLDEVHHAVVCRKTFYFLFYFFLEEEVLQEEELQTP